MVREALSAEEDKEQEQEDEEKRDEPLSVGLRGWSEQGACHGGAVTCEP